MGNPIANGGETQKGRVGRVGATVTVTKLDAEAEAEAEAEGWYVR